MLIEHQEAVGQYVRSRRRAALVSQDVLATRAGVPTIDLARLESGVVISTATLTSVLSALQADEAGPDEAGPGEDSRDAVSRNSASHDAAGKVSPDWAPAGRAVTDEPSATVLLQRVPRQRADDVPTGPFVPRTSDH